MPKIELSENPLEKEMSSTTINIRCQDSDIAEQVAYEIGQMLEEIQDTYGYEVDTNFDLTPNGTRIIKIKHDDRDT